MFEAVVRQVVNKRVPVFLKKKRHPSRKDTVELQRFCKISQGAVVRQLDHKHLN